MYWPNLKSVAVPVPQIIGGSRKNGQSLDTPRSIFWKRLMGFCSDGFYEYVCQMDVRGFTRSWDREYLKNWAVPGFSH